MRKLWIPLILSVIVLGFAGCGDKKESSKGSIRTNTETEATGSIGSSETTPITTSAPTPVTPEESESIFPESRIGYYSNGYWGMDIKVIDNDAKTVTYDGYEYAIDREMPVCQDKTATIVDANTLIAGSVTIPWVENSFTLTGKYDSAFMSGEASGAHDYENGPGTYVKCEKPTPEAGAGDSSEYILPNSSTSYLTDGEISGLTDDELQMAINEIYARHGRRFQDSGIQSYFDGKSWYQGIIEPDDFDESVLSDVELQNIEKLRAYMNSGQNDTYFVTDDITGMYNNDFESDNYGCHINIYQSDGSYYADVRISKKFRASVVVSDYIGYYEDGEILFMIEEIEDGSMFVNFPSQSDGTGWYVKEY